MVSEPLTGRVVNSAAGAGEQARPRATAEEPRHALLRRPQPPRWRLPRPCLGGPVCAATPTSTLGVRVVVQPSCTVSGATLDFGTYTSGQATALNGFTQISLQQLPRGRSSASSSTAAPTAPPTARRLGNGSGGLLNYGIYRNSGRTQNFGQGTEARLVTLAAAGSGKVSVYGQIPAGKSWRPEPTPTRS